MTEYIQFKCQENEEHPHANVTGLLRNTSSLSTATYCSVEMKLVSDLFLRPIR